MSDGSTEGDLRTHPPPGPRAGLRLQLLLALGALTLLAFVPLFLAVASLTRHTLRANREEGARALARAVAGRLSSDASAGRDEQALRDVAFVSLDTGGDVGGEGGVVAVRVERAPSLPPIEVGHAATVVVLRELAKGAPPGERTVRGQVPGSGPILDVEIGTASARVQVALRIGDQASRAAPLLRLLAFYTAAFAVVLLVFAYLLLTRLIVRPIGGLVSATRRLESGASRRIDPSVAAAGAAAEVVELGSAIARTTARLVEREEALAAKVRQLEEAKAELIAARDAIIRSERLASVGRLSAGLAHEVGNPIAALLGLEDVVLGSDLDEETRDLVARMKRETERVHRVMRDLLDFARAGEPGLVGDAPASCEVGEVVQEVVALLSPQRVLRDVELSVEVQGGLPRARIGGGRLQQVLLNLILNASDALADPVGAGAGARRGGGKLGRVIVRACRDEGPFLRLEVEDDGPGVPAAIRPHLFEPFVTTKDVGKGTGLGLAVCRGLVEAVGGTIALDSGHDGGARFVVRLPTPEAPPPPRSVAPPSFGARGHDTGGRGSGPV